MHTIALAGLGTERPADLDRNEKAIRRILAGADLAAGMRQSAVADKYGTTRTSVSRWARRIAAAKGDVRKALLPTKATGRPAKLPCSVKALANMWDPVFTAPVFALLIKATLGISYSPDHVGTMIRRFGLKRMPRCRQTPSAATVVVN
jgi:transposase